MMADVVEVLSRPALAGLWAEVGGRGWLPASGARVLVQIASAHRGARVVETVRSLVAFLHAGSAGIQIELAGALATDDFGTLRRRDLGTEGTLSVAGVALPRGVVVPAAWFEPLRIITVTGVGPDPRAGFTGALAAQAEVLARLANPDDPEALVYEAHRLAASDLVIACGEERGGWWAVAADDIALDLALAQAAGLAPERLPWLRALARHELVPNVRLVGTLPRLRGAVAPLGPVAARAAGRRARVVLRQLAEDAVAFRRNVHKIPHALARRLAALRRGWQPG